MWSHDCDVGMGQQKMHACAFATAAPSVAEHLTRTQLLESGWQGAISCGGLWALPGWRIRPPPLRGQRRVERETNTFTYVFI